ncbi:uncharacterized protein [Blastocystis hominis]|uniref:MICOS complex subunit MIC10 n=1 Tax=Blastocystis hominis TaxID=12968 RepID=D8M1Q1_BLAHO|nr:uncharacterized protein [Blastocystis hominis]CBK21990.2 unnamed protein product [Blastocystis hominis]|eukprot:XP_012896038.1 uncharacterized protein [Blastocystis hominis]
MSNNLVNNINNSKQSTIIDPFCKQAWIEYGRRFCINSITGLAIGAAFAFVLLGKPTHRAASMALGLGWGIGSSWSRTNIDIHNRREAKKKHRD